MLNPAPLKDVPMEEVDILVDKFNLGLINLIDESRLPKEAARESINLIQAEDGRWTTRWGTGYYGTAPTNADIDGATQYVVDEDTRHLIVVADGKVWKSTDNGDTWAEVTGATLTAGYQCYFLQIKGYLYIANGQDALVRYNGTVLSTYTALDAPTNLELALTNLTTGSYTVYYQVVAVNDVGFTPACTEVSITVNRIRDNWSSTDKVALTWDAVDGATRYEIYYSDESGNEVYLDSTTLNSYNDTGVATPNPYVEAPIDNTTTGPKVKSLELSGNRIWATKDTDNAYRVWWGGSGQYQGYFSAFYGGGWIDLEKGGKEFPSSVVHYKDGKGNQFATVLTSDAEGRGSIWQISLEQLTVGNVSFIIPSAMKIVGSVGTPAPLAVVKAKDNIYYPNKKGGYTTGSKPTLLNVLATDEITNNIRPFWKTLRGSYLKNACGIYWDGKVLWSVARNSNDNDTTVIIDTERKNATYATFGAKQFFEFTDTFGETHLMMVPISGHQLVEIADGYQGDLGVPFKTSYISGLLPIHRDRTKWAKIPKVYLELGRPQGAIDFEVVGIQKKKGYTSLGHVTITDVTSNVGFSSQKFSDFSFSDTSKAPTTYASASVTKYIKVNKLLNAIAVKVTTESLTAKHTLLRWQAKGYIIPTQDPSSYKTN